MTARMGRRASRPDGRAWGFAAVLLAALAASCDKMPLVAPSDTTITLYASTTIVGLNGTVDITATVIEPAGTPVQNGTVVTFTTTLGTLSPAEARTSGGKATVRLTAGSTSGTAEIHAFSGSSRASGLSISIGAAAAGSVTLLANPSALPAAGGTVLLTAVVNDKAGNRLAGVPVAFSTDNGVLSQTAVMSDGNGEARTSLTTTATSSVKASVVGGSSGEVSASVSVKVRVGPTVTVSIPSSSLVPGVPAVFSVSVTPGGAAVQRAIIDFGDGASQAVSNAGLSSVTHTYHSSGTYVVKATATDAAGETASATASVSVQTVVVTVSLSVGASVITTTAPAEFTATATTTPIGSAIERFEWDFGDGSTRVTSGGTTSHLYQSGGGRRYTVTVRAVTLGGASGSAQREIVVQ
ncbi:MAG TPA: PKD domain-containing protein [Vicinamibacterales bacterium]|nr:PKD domain-containing protein [Vicinamibacterales bacterium]HPK71055.1 PKD domain-containing protein [Vicinamibacterales bacterium]